MKPILHIIILFLLTTALYAQAPPIEWDSTDPATFIDFGNGLIRMGEYRAALRAFDRALELDPNLVDALLAKARLYRRMNDIAAAIQEYNNVLAHRRATGEAKSEAELGLGILEHNEERVREAQIHFENAIAMNPNNAQAYYYKGLCHEFYDEYEDAANAYRRASDLQPASSVYERALDRILEILMW